MAKNNTAEKEKEFLACIDNVYDQSWNNRGIQLLKDGRIICYDEMKKIKIYKYIDKKFMLDLEFEIEGIRSVTCLYEVEENIIILGSYMKLFLYDIRNNEAKLLQKFEYDNMSVFDQIIKLSNGLIAAAFFNVIIFYKYDEENKKLEKKDEIKTRGSIKKIYETKNGNLISFETDEIISFGKDKRIQFKMTTTNLIHYYDVIDDKYILISRINQQYEGKNFVDVYDIKKMILMQTFETKYQLFEFIKLNDNLIIASDVFGNIHELNIDENDKLSLRDIFRASDYKITK